MSGVEGLSSLLEVLAELLRGSHEVLEELPHKPDKRVPMKCSQFLNEVSRYSHGQEVGLSSTEGFYCRYLDHLGRIWTIVGCPGQGLCSELWYKREREREIEREMGRGGSEREAEARCYSGIYIAQCSEMSNFHSEQNIKIVVSVLHGGYSNRVHSTLQVLMCPQVLMCEAVILT